jgi:hypothetical protein
VSDWSDLDLQSLTLLARRSSVVASGALAPVARDGLVEFWVVALITVSEVDQDIPHAEALGVV